MSPSPSHLSAPEKGTRWKNPKMRHVWVVATVGPKYVTLSTSFPTAGPLKVDRSMWPGSWEPAR